MSDLQNTAACGLYCPDCIWLNNAMSPLAARLLDEMAKAGLDEYAAIKSPFGSELTHFTEMKKALEFIAARTCKEPCRVGGGCSGRPCEAMKCAEEKKYQGCWQCGEYKTCHKLDVLELRCGKAPRGNLAKIAVKGPDDWSGERLPFYIWQKHG